jgi:hypothetical protein
MGISLFNKPNYKRFDLKTRYYDEEKTEFERRMRKWEREKKGEENGFNKEDFKADIKREWQNSRESKSSFNQRYTNGKRMLVLVIIVAVLLWAMYFIGKKYLV